MSNFGGKNVQNSISAGAPPQNPFEELTVLPLTPWLSWLHLRGHISKGRGGEEEGRVNEGEKVGRKRSLPPPQSSPQIDATAYTPDVFDGTVVDIVDAERIKTAQRFALYLQGLDGRSENDSSKNVVRPQWTWYARDHARGKNLAGTC